MNIGQCEIYSVAKAVDTASISAAKIQQAVDYKRITVLEEPLDTKGRKSFVELGISGNRPGNQSKFQIDDSDTDAFVSGL